MRTLLFICCIIFLQEFAKPQSEDLRFDHITSKNGLSQNSVNCILQDDIGFLWFGTCDGLDRYDGYTFKVFRNDLDDTTTLTSNWIFSIYKDSSGTLWIGTMGGGLSKYNKETESFENFRHNDNDLNSISSNEILSIFEDHFKTLWVGTSGGLDEFISKDKKFKHFRNNPDDPNSLSNNIVYAIYEDHFNELWIGTWGGGLDKFDRKKESFIRYHKEPGNINSLSENHVCSLIEDSNNNLLIGTGKGLNKFNLKTHTFTHFTHDPVDQNSISSNLVNKIILDNNSDLWIATWNKGLNKFIVGQSKFISYSHDPYKSTSLGADKIFSLFEDRSGIIWVGTNNAGIDKLVQKKQQFALYKNNLFDSQSLSSNIVNAIYEDKFGDIWIGTNDGLNKFDQNKGIFLRYNKKPDDPNSLSCDVINSIYEDRAGNLWIGTSCGLNNLNRKNGKFHHYRYNPENPNSLSNDFIGSIYEDSFGFLWVGTNVGLNKFDVDQNTFVRYFHIPDDPSSLSSNDIYVLFEDKMKNLWIGTLGGGLDQFDRQTQKFEHYRYDPNDHSSISNDDIFCIYESSSGDLWIGTNGGGLNKLDRSNGTFEKFGLKNGLPSNVIYGILEDGSGNIWFSTNKGLTKFNPRNLDIKNFDVTDGIQDDEFTGARFKSKAGEMFFGGINGFNAFQPDSINKKNTHIPPIAIINFQLMQRNVPIGYDSTLGRSILEKSITETKRIELNYDDNVISFEFSALDFGNPQRNKYAYIMKGFDKKWTYTGADRRFVTYTNLDPGEYTFRVKGSNNDDVWNEEGTSIKLIIIPPWWKTTWAYILYGLTIVLSLYGIRRYELNRSNLKNQVKLDEVKLKEREETDKMKSRFFANISHEFRTPLTLILGPTEKLISKFHDEEIKQETGIIKRNANRLLDLINQLLDLSRLEAGKLELKASKSNIVSFIKGITMSFESVAERKDITLKVKAEQENIELYFDKEKMTKIMTNLLSNAFKFTPEGGEITVSLSLIPSPSGRGVSNLSAAASAKAGGQGEGSVQITVFDTGIGISEEELPKLFDRFYQVDSSQTREHEGTGIGLALTKELVELHRGTISADSKLGKWTEFTIKLPVGREHLTDGEIVEEIQTTEGIILNEINNLSDFDTVDSSKKKLQKDNEINEDKNIILVVEDNRDVREFIKDSLGNEFQIEEASNGEQGVRKAEQIIPDLIISDIMMPKMDGNELTRRIKNDERTSHIPVILLTAKSEQESRLEGLETGADDYLTKPFDTKELKIRIKNLIDIRRRLQEKFTGGRILQRKGEKKLSSLDENFFRKVLGIAEMHLSEEEYSIEEFVKEAGMSRTNFHRKLKALTGKSPSLYLRSVRLAKAKELIEDRKGNISEIAYSVGFSSPQYFTRCFKEEFGFSPSDLVH